MNSFENYHDRLVEIIQLNSRGIKLGIDCLVQEILDVNSVNGHIWLVGNGGSASTAEHFETDLSFLRYGNLKESLSVEALTGNSAIVTAAANDASYDDLFTTILRKKARSGDLLVAISASGNSRNILNAIEFSKSQGVKTFSILGFDGGKAKLISDQSLIISTNLGEYGVVEDVHLSICHAVSMSILKKFLIQD